jgi:hypothetical protein
VLVLAVMLGVIACGGSTSAPPARSGLAEDARVGMLDMPQMKTLCAWMNQVRGGYNRQIQCTNGIPQSTNSSLQQCVDTLPQVNISCAPLTVADLEGCYLAAGTDLCQINTLDACTNLRHCYDQDV